MRLLPVVKPKNGERNVLRLNATTSVNSHFQKQTRNWDMKAKVYSFFNEKKIASVVVEQTRLSYLYSVAKYEKTCLSVAPTAKANDIYYYSPISRTFF